MNVKKLTQNDSAYPSKLRDIPSSPKELFYVGTTPSYWLSKPKVAVVGSRGVTPYGEQVTHQLARELAERGVVIVSGLALGVDAVAHTACLEAGGITVAVLANGLDKIAPATNRHIGERMLEQGGSILSEYPVGTPVFKTNFVARNRIVAGLADALLITEASEKSGTLHTARFALEQGRDVLVVPGNITNPNSVGTNRLIKSGAIPVTCVDDILYALGASHLPVEKVRRTGDTPEEQTLLDLLYAGVSDGHELLTQTQLAAVQFNQALTMLEISGKIRPIGGNQWILR